MGVSDRQVAEAILALAKRQQESEQMLQSVFQELQEARSIIDTLQNYDGPAPLTGKRSFEDYSSSSDSSPDLSPLAFSPEPKKMKSEFHCDYQLLNPGFPFADNGFYDFVDQPCGVQSHQGVGAFPTTFD